MPPLYSAVRSQGAGLQNSSRYVKSRLAESQSGSEPCQDVAQRCLLGIGNYRAVNCIVILVHHLHGGRQSLGAVEFYWAMFCFSVGSLAFNVEDRCEAVSKNQMF